MSDANRHFTPGEAIRSLPAALLNDLVEMRRLYRAGRFTPGRGVGGEWPAGGVILLRNMTEDPWDQYSIRGLDSPTISPADNLQEFKVVPYLDGLESPAAWRPFAILQEPVPSGGSGRALVAGWTAVQVNVLSLSHRFAQLEFTGSCTSGSSAELRSADCGCPILDPPASTGLQWLRVSLPVGEQRFSARITSATPIGGTSGRWTYGFAESEKATVGHAGWADLTGGWTGSALNSVETLDLAGRFPAQVGEIVEVWPQWTADGNLEYWFQYDCLAACEC